MSDERANIILSIVLTAMLAAMLGIIFGIHVGYDRGVEHVCNSPQVPFRMIPLPACATENESSE